MCKCPHHKVFPLLVVLFGLTFLLGAVGYLTPAAVSITWPILVIIAGIFKMKMGGCRCCDKDKM